MINCINLIIEMSPRFILGRENVPCVAEVVNRSLKADCTDYTWDKACSHFLSLLCISQFQALPFPPPPQAISGQVFKNRQIPAPSKFFVSNPRGAGFPGTLDFNKLYTFSPYSRLQSLIYTLNIYKLIYALNIYKLVRRI